MAAHSLRDYYSILGTWVKPNSLELKWQGSMYLLRKIKELFSRFSSLMSRKEKLEGNTYVSDMSCGCKMESGQAAQSLSTLPIR